MDSSTSNFSKYPEQPIWDFLEEYGFPWLKPVKEQKTLPNETLQRLCVAAIRPLLPMLKTEAMAQLARVTDTEENYPPEHWSCELHPTDYAATFAELLALFSSKWGAGKLHKAPNMTSHSWTRGLASAELSYWPKSASQKDQLLVEIYPGWRRPASEIESKILKSVPSIAFDGVQGVDLLPALHGQGSFTHDYVRRLDTPIPSSVPLLGFDRSIQALIGAEGVHGIILPIADIQLCVLERIWRGPTTIDLLAEFKKSFKKDRSESLRSASLATSFDTTSLLRLAHKVSTATGLDVQFRSEDHQY